MQRPKSKRESLINLYYLQFVGFIVGSKPYFFKVKNIVHDWSKKKKKKSFMVGTRKVKKKKKVKVLEITKTP